MNNPNDMDNFLTYKQRYESRLDRILRHRGRDHNLTYCLGLWLNSTVCSKLQEMIKQKRLTIFFVTHLLSLLLIAFAAAFLFAFAWYFFP